jgi:hypothetical protein
MWLRRGSIGVGAVGAEAEAPMLVEHPTMRSGSALCARRWTNRNLMPPLSLHAYAHDAEAGSSCGLRQAPSASFSHEEWSTSSNHSLSFESWMGTSSCRVTSWIAMKPSDARWRSSTTAWSEHTWRWKHEENNVCFAVIREATYFF